MAYKTVIFDFHGVLCSDRLFTNLYKNYPETEDFIETNIFGRGKDIAYKWMRGEMDTKSVNKHISENTGIDAGLLYDFLIEGINNMRIEKRLIDLVKNLRDKNIDVALVTDNMDIFDRVTVKVHKLNEIFPVIINSCNYGIMKEDYEGKLFDIALERLGANSYRRSLLVDDSLGVKPIFEKKGGEVFTYENYEKFESLMGDKLFRKDVQ